MLFQWKTEQQQRLFRLELSAKERTEATENKKVLFSFSQIRVEFLADKQDCQRLPCKKNPMISYVFLIKKVSLFIFCCFFFKCFLCTTLICQILNQGKFSYCVCLS